MVYAKIAGWVAAGVVMTGCPDDSEQSESTGSSTTDGPTDPTATTIPLPTTITATVGGGSDSSTGSSSSDEGSTTASVDSSTGDPDPGTTTDEPGTTSETGTSGTYDIGWCLLQFPPSVNVEVDEVWTVYVRVFAAGLTDQTGVTDPDPNLVVELGYGLDGSDPSIGVGAPWTYVPATPNVGYGPGAPDYSAANDEYQGDLSIGMAGIYDYAPRISGDGGMTWVWCDVDGLTEGGYTPDQAGSAEVGQ